MSDERLAGKVAIVTGGAGGIGRGIIRQLLAAGARVAIADIANTNPGLSAKQADATIALDVDVTDEDSVIAMVADTVSHFGRLDILCNNAGVDGDVVPLAECTLANYQRVVSVNLQGVFLGIKAAVPKMLERGGGTIINTASAAGIVGMPGLAVYSASKAAVIGLTRSAALEYSPLGIRVNAICPGMIDTPILQSIARSNPEQHAELTRAALAMTAVGRIGTPADIGNAVVFLASDESSFVTGTILSVDGGYTAV
jgi:NAD(P)-dependent dehydrogenase (short-subunit alcohol dehydrogenase family)